MITKETITHRQAQKLLELVEHWARCEVASRMAPIPWPEYGDFAYEALQTRDKILDLVLDSHCYAELAERWNILKPQSKTKQKKTEPTLFDPQDRLAKLRQRLNKPTRRR